MRALVLVVSTLILVSVRPCLAQDAPPADAAPAAPPAIGTPAAKPETKASETPVARVKAPAPVAACPPPKAVVFVSDWERLAELTRSDSLIYERADSLAQRNQTVRDVSVGGVVLGGGIALLAGVHALSNDHWSRFDNGALTVGIGVGALSLFISWLSDHNRDDFYTLINQWNLRHPEQRLAP